LIAIAFSLLSIYLIQRILRYWLEPLSALLGTALWAFAPLVLHFGSVPMPDILCTSGLMLAFYLALWGKLARSSAAFAFAVLAKESVLAFGLPVLVALLLARSIGTPRAAARISILWGVAPGILLLAWLLLGRFGPSTPWTVLQTANDSSRGPMSDLLSPPFYFESLACLLPFGMGVIGFVALLFACTDTELRMDRHLKLSIIFACVFYWVFIVRKILEPQYFLPLLFWLVISTSFGFSAMRQKLRSGRLWSAALGVAMLAHCVVAWCFASDLKVSRVPDYPAIERAAQLLPPGARVGVVGKTYGASPAVWLNRNVEAISEIPADLDKNLSYLESIGFRYLIILDLESRHSRKSQRLVSLPSSVFTLNLLFTGTNSHGALTHFCDRASPTRLYCDAHFQRIFESPYTVLYALRRISQKPERLR
jgi:hypothetical protein